MLISTKAYARACLVGNPSDGYFGKTISFIVRNYCAQVTLFESPELTIEPIERDHSVFGSIDALASDVRQFGVLRWHPPVESQREAFLRVLR